MIGTGRAGDARRPMFAPTPASGQREARATPAGETEITGFRYELSDDRRLALVEFTARHPRAFAAITSSTHPDVKVFARNTATVADVEREFRKHKPSFDAQKFLGGRP